MCRFTGVHWYSLLKVIVLVQVLTFSPPVKAVTDYLKCGMLAKSIMEEIKSARVASEPNRDGLDGKNRHLIIDQMENRPTLAIHVDRYERVTVAANIFSRRYNPNTMRAIYTEALFYLDEYDRDIIARKLRGDEYFKDKEITIIVPKVRPADSREAHKYHAEMQLLKHRREQINRDNLSGQSRVLSRVSAIGISKTACQDCCKQLKSESENFRPNVTFYFKEQQARAMEESHWTLPENIGDLEEIAISTKEELENQPIETRPKYEPLQESVNARIEARHKQKYSPPGIPPYASGEKNVETNSDKLTQENAANVPTTSGDSNNTLSSVIDAKTPRICRKR